MYLGKQLKIIHKTKYIIPDKSTNTEVYENLCICVVGPIPVNPWWPTVCLRVACGLLLCDVQTLDLSAV